MPKKQNKWDGAEELTINNFFKIDSIFFLNMLFRVQIDRSQPMQPQYFISTEVDRNTAWRQVSSGTHIDWSNIHVSIFQIRTK